jgi:ribosomal protein L11 methyltransferase
MLELFPEGFEEVESASGVELVAYTDSAGEERLWHAFGGGRGEDVAADWSERWKSFHRPIRIGSLWVGPPWQEPPGDVTAVVIDPGRAFGTGSHATTRLCLELLLQADPGSAVDLGCGSGVLGIVASKLGFAPVIAIDHDQNAVAATLANARRNGVDLEIRQADVLTEELPATDMAIANITRQAIEGLADRLRSRLVIASGYLPTESVGLPPYRHLQRISRDGWAADLFGLP